MPQMQPLLFVFLRDPNLNPVRTVAVEQIEPFLFELIHSAAVLIVFSYLITRTKWFSEVLERKLTLRNQLANIICFGLMAAYGSYSGIEVMGAVANTRYIGPVIAGLVGGPVAGVGAGILGGICRWFVSSGAQTGIDNASDFARLPSVISTVVAGLAAGIFYHFTTRKTGRFPRAKSAALFAAGVQVYHMGQLLLMCEPFEKALALVRLIAAPMIIANALGTGIFFYIMINLLKERAARAQRDHYLAQKLKIEGELSVARDIQMSLVPKMYPKIPEWPHCQLYASLRSAREVGGDLYEFFLDHDGKLVFAIGDVSDKGVPAALFMAVTKTLLKALSEPGQKPHELLERMNREIAEENDALMFITLFCGSLDLQTGELYFSNAGHNPPLLVRQGQEVEWLKLPKGFVLGPDGSSRFKSESITLKPGDSLITYTDGVTEAMNPQRKLYSDARLIETVRSAAHSSPEEFVHLIAQSVDEHASGEPQSDDITILALRYTG